MKTIGILHNEASLLSILPAWTSQSGDTLPDLLVECAAQPLFAHALNLDTPLQYPGLRGCLVDPARWNEFSLSHEHAPAALMLCPLSGLTPAHAAMALRRLGETPEAPERVGVLIEAATFLEWLPVLSALDETIAIWDSSLPFFGDAADPEAWTKLLLAVGSRWRGLFAYDTTGSPSASATLPRPFQSMQSISWLRSKPL